MTYVAANHQGVIITLTIALLGRPLAHIVECVPHVQKVLAAVGVQIHPQPVFAACRPLPPPPSPINKGVKAPKIILKNHIPVFSVHMRHDSEPACTILWTFNPNPFYYLHLCFSHFDMLKILSEKGSLMHILGE